MRASVVIVSSSLLTRCIIASEPAALPILLQLLSQSTSPRKTRRARSELFKKIQKKKPVPPYHPHQSSVRVLLAHILSGLRQKATLRIPTCRRSQGIVCVQTYLPKLIPYKVFSREGQSCQYQEQGHRSLYAKHINSRGRRCRNVGFRLYARGDRGYGG